jgi:hypothetical protein
MIRKLCHSLLLILSCVLLFVTCRKSGTSWDTDLTSPIFTTSFGIDNLIPDSLLVKNPDSSLVLVYNKTLCNFSLDSLFNLPDTTLLNDYRLPLGSFTFHSGDAITPSAPGNMNTTSYSLHGAGLKTVFLRSGVMRVRVTNKVRKKIQLNYQIPSASINGQPFNRTVMVPGRTGSSAGSFSADYDLSGYTVDLSGQNHNSINTVVTIINANIDPTAPATDTVLVTSADDLAISSTFQKLVPGYARGYFGQSVQNLGPTENVFPVFSKIIAGALQLQSIQLTFHIDNSIGLDARINIPSIYSKNSRTGQTVQLSAPIINNPININRAQESFSVPPVIPTHYTTTLNNSNSNTKALIENLPDKLGFQLSITPNPMGNVSGYNDFVYYGDGLKAGMDLQMPLSMVASNLTIADTLNVNFDKVSSNVNRLHSCFLTLYAENGFPFDAAVQLFMMDQNGHVKDSLIGSMNHIDPAPVDASFKATAKRETILRIPVNETKIANLIGSKKLMILARFNTSSKPNFIKIYDAYKIDFQLTGDFNYTIKVQ